MNLKKLAGALAAAVMGSVLLAPAALGAPLVHCQESSGDSGDCTPTTNFTSGPGGFGGAGAPSGIATGGTGNAGDGGDGAGGAGVEAYLVDSLVQWDEPDDDPANGDVTPMRLAFIVARADLTAEEFVQRWREHAPVAKKHQPDFRRYVQHVVREGLTPSCGPYAAIGEFGFRRLRAGEGIRRFDSPEGQVVVEADIARFLERSGARSVWIRPA